MYDFIGKEEYLSPEESLKKYMYFSGEDDEAKQGLMEEQQPSPVNLNLTDLHRSDFQEILKNSSLSDPQRKAYYNYFIKTKRIYKREMAKLRWTGLASATSSIGWEASLPANMLCLEERMVTEDNSTTVKTDNEEKDEDQKRKKRMSAQISRDRKKMHIERIEAQNRFLKEQNQKLQSENQKLRSDLEAWKKRHTNLDSPLKSIFIMSLILLASVNKDKLESQLSAMNRESLLKGATNILEEYMRGEVKVTPIEWQDFKLKLRNDEVKQEHLDRMSEQQQIKLPVGIEHTYYSRCPTKDIKIQGGCGKGKKGRRVIHQPKQLVH